MSNLATLRPTGVPDPLVLQGGAISIGDATGTAVTIESSGVITGSAFIGIGAYLTELNSGQLVGALPELDGSGLFNLQAANLSPDGLFPAGIDGSQLIGITVGQVQSASGITPIADGAYSSPTTITTVRGIIVNIT